MYRRKFLKTRRRVFDLILRGVRAQGQSQQEALLPRSEGQTSGRLAARAPDGIPHRNPGEWQQPRPGRSQDIFRRETLITCNCQLGVEGEGGRKGGKDEAQGSWTAAWWLWSWLQAKATCDLPGLTTGNLQGLLSRPPREAALPIPDLVTADAFLEGIAGKDSRLPPPPSARLLYISSFICTPAFLKRLLLEEFVSSWTQYLSTSHASLCLPSSCFHKDRGGLEWGLERKSVTPVFMNKDKEGSPGGGNAAVIQGALNGAQIG